MDSFPLPSPAMGKGLLCAHICNRGTRTVRFLRKKDPVFDTLYDLWGRFIDDAYPFGVVITGFVTTLFARFKIGTRFGMLGV